MPKNLLDYTREELQAQLDEHLPLRPEPGGPISELPPPEYRAYMKALETWNDRKNALELGLFLKREKSDPVVTESRASRDETRSEVLATKPAPIQVQAPPPHPTRTHQGGRDAEARQAGRIRPALQPDPCHHARAGGR